MQKNQPLANQSPRMRARIAKDIHRIVRDKRTIDWAFEQNQVDYENPEPRALLYGVIRHYFSLRDLVDACLEKPLRKKDQDLTYLIMVGAYQLKHTRTPVHAAINETVSACIALKKPWAKGLVNAVLRRIHSSHSRIEARAEPKNERSFECAPWLVSQLQADYPNEWSALLKANNTRAPMALRVNGLKCDRTTMMQRLEQANLDYVPGQPAQAIILKKPIASAQLPGWDEGLVAVQDAGAQYAASLLHEEIRRYCQLESSRTASRPIRTLDACAAPGGKLANLLELQRCQPIQGEPAFTNLALEVSPDRAAATRRILKRLGHEVDITVGNATDQDWWSGEPFDYILLDAPCSGTGTIRRHPDIKLILTPDAVEAHTKLQSRLLHNLWETLNPGGTLLYCTCSVLNAENDEVIERFLASMGAQVQVQSVELPSGRATRYGWQLLPTDPDTDGFYYALLHKS